MKKFLAFIFIIIIFMVSCGKKGDPYPKKSLHDEIKKEKGKDAK